MPGSLSTAESRAVGSGVVDAVLLGLLAGALAGASNVSLHVGLQRVNDVEAGALVMILVAFVMVALTAVAVEHESVSWEALWPFLLMGVVGPGLSTILFVTAVSRAGASRSAVLANTFPLFATVLAIALLGESVRVALVLGTLLVVTGAIGLTLAGGAPSRARGWFLRIGMAAALLAALSIAARDVAVRWIGEGRRAFGRRGKRRDTADRIGNVGGVRAVHGGAVATRLLAWARQ